MQNPQRPAKLVVRNWALAQQLCLVVFHATPATLPRNSLVALDANQCIDWRTCHALRRAVGKLSRHFVTTLDVFREMSGKHVLVPGTLHVVVSPPVGAALRQLTRKAPSADGKVAGEADLGLMQLAMIVPQIRLLLSRDGDFFRGEPWAYINKIRDEPCWFGKGTRIHEAPTHAYARLLEVAA